MENSEEIILILKLKIENGIDLCSNNLDKYVDIFRRLYRTLTLHDTSAYIKEDWRKKLGAVNHVDNSTRPQILKHKHNPFLYELIETVYKDWYPCFIEHIF